MVLQIEDRAIIGRDYEYHMCILLFDRLRNQFLIFTGSYRFFSFLCKKYRLLRVV